MIGDWQPKIGGGSGSISHTSEMKSKSALGTDSIGHCESLKRFSAMLCAVDLRVRFFLDCNLTVVEQDIYARSAD
jgi:hypothetical protein